MRDWRMRAWLLVTVAGIGTAFSFPALAQSTGGVEEVVVTAERRTENLQQTPAAVTAISTETLIQTNIATTRDLMQIVPSLQVAPQTAADGGGSAVFFLRGMGQQRVGNGSEPAVGVYVDGFYYPSLEGDIFNIVDLADVEVLRGPQGTLFGRNTVGGAIQYTSQQPELGTFGGHATATYGSYNRTDFTGAVNVPIGDTAAVRLTLGHLEQNGFVKVQSGGPEAGATNTNLARIQFKWQPISSLTVDLEAMMDRSNLKGFTYNVPGPLTPVPGSTLPYTYNILAPILHLPLYTDALKSRCFYCEPGTSGPEFSTTDYENVLGTITWTATTWLTVKSLTGWQNVDTHTAFDLDSTPDPLFYSGITKIRQNTLSEELQFAGEVLDDRLNYVSGLYYYQDHKPANAQVTSGILLGSPASIVTPQELKTKSYAAYLDLTYKVTDALTLIGGYRYSEDRKQTTVELTPAVDLSKTYASTTWRAGAQYQWTPDIMTYFTVSTGFRAGGFNPYQSGVGIVPFEPEKVTSYEAGARFQFLDDKLTFNPTGFYYNWDKIQVQSVYFPPGAAAGVVVLQNAGAAEGKGFELEGNYLVAPGFKLFGNLATLDLHYTNIGTASGITIHSPLEHAPKLTYSVGASYTHDLGSAGSLTTSLNFSHEGQQNSTPTDDDTLILPAYSLLNARIEWDTPDMRYSLAVFGTNLGGEHYYVGGTNFYSTVGAAQYALGSPREFGVQGRVNF